MPLSTVTKTEEKLPTSTKTSFLTPALAKKLQEKRLLAWNALLHSFANTNTRKEAVSTAVTKTKRYFRRLLKFNQMDFQYAFWQMIYLFVNPRKVYRNFHYRKQTRNQYSRDDPAFLVLLSLWLCLNGIGFSIVLQLSFFGSLKFILWGFFVDCIGSGLLIATVMWFVANNFMLRRSCLSQDLEWGYAFDIHLNAYFPLLTILHFFQMTFLDWILNHFSLMSTLTANTTCLVATGYYIYISFLGYDAVPILKNTRRLLIPGNILFFVYIGLIIANWNVTQNLCRFYKYRIQ